MRQYRTLVALMLCMVWYFSSGQSEFTLGFEPELAHTIFDSDHWQVDGSFSIRYLLDRNRFEDGLYHAEWEATGKYKTASGFRFGLGYMFRWRTPFLDDNAYEHRLLVFTQFKHTAGSLDLGHRLRLDRRFFNIGDATRLRYRVGTKFPLGKAAKGNNRLYLSLYDEFLIQWRQNENVKQNRIYTGIGFPLKQRAKLEIGPEYRMTGLFESVPVDHFVLIKITLSI